MFKTSNLSWPHLFMAIALQRQCLYLSLSSMDDFIPLNFQLDTPITWQKYLAAQVKGMKH